MSFEYFKVSLAVYLNLSVPMVSGWIWHLC